MPQSDTDLIQHAQRCVQQAYDAESHNRAAFQAAMRFAAGDQWHRQDASERDAAKRPMLTINKTEAFIRQVTNSQRQHRPAMKVHPVDSIADPDTAQVIQGLLRNIEVQSEASTAFDHAHDCAAIGGWGYVRIRADYVDERSFDQTLRIEMIESPLSVFFDTQSIYPSGQDAEWCLIVEQMARPAFARKYPKATAGAVEFAGESPGVVWADEYTVTVAEYYYVDYQPATLALLATGETAWEDELADGAPIIRTRQSHKRLVQWVKLTSREVLEKRTIPGRWLPVVRVAGQARLVDGKRHRYGMVRALMDSQREYNYARTAMTEFIAMMPRARWKAAAGQVEQYLHIWENSTRADYLVLPYDPVSNAGHPVPPPEYIPFDGPPQALVQMALSASDDMKAAVGIYDASLGQRSNETSGVAIHGRQQQGETANFHYDDNLRAAVRQVGRVLLDQIPAYYSAPQVLQIIGEDGTTQSVEVNTPTMKHGVMTVLNNLSTGRYDVTISAGPSYQTRRQESAELGVELSRTFPKVWDVAGDIMVKSMDFPDAEAIATRLKKTLPPGLADDDQADPEQQLAQMQAVLQQTVQKLQALNAYAQQCEQQVQGAQQALQEAQQKLASKDRELALKEQELILKGELEAMKLALQAAEVEMKDREQLFAMQARVVDAAERRVVATSSLGDTDDAE